MCRQEMELKNREVIDMGETVISGR
ncbi:hypothetical protein PITCH_A1010004 [uncultured Desulfobacterium sp.]|uniref:Uncharacterized protein n=1 Tax=uncultured Desulfobacterium sp. TaxID=201089 RepID=A0A445MQJ7_9BACT|nr:hypothetical protein PITCH_A1010004 [uncultured Desulfobacterium sp.]